MDYTKEEKIEKLLSIVLNEYDKGVFGINEFIEICKQVCSLSTEYEIDGEYDSEGNAKHYDDGRINVMVMLERIFGTYETMIFCEMNAFKYRSRMGKKLSQSVSKELIKAEWYEKAANFFRLRLQDSSSIVESIGAKKLKLQWEQDKEDLPF